MMWVLAYLGVGFLCVFVASLVAEEEVDIDFEKFGPILVVILIGWPFVLVLGMLAGVCWCATLLARQVRKSI